MKNFTAIVFCLVLASVVFETEAQRNKSKRNSGGGGFDVRGMLVGVFGKECVDWAENALCGSNGCSILSALGIGAKLPKFMKEVMTCSQCEGPRTLVMDKVKPFMAMMGMK